MLASEESNCQEKTHHRLSILEYQLLIQLGQVEPVLALSGLNVDLGQEFSDKLDDLGKDHLVGIVVGGALETCFEKERVTGESSGRFGEVAVELELARLGEAFGFLFE